MKQLMIGLIHFYQKYLSSRKPYNTCKYLPTCSEYAVQAIQKHGALKGGFLAFWRILRCNPFSKGGVDMVPEKIVLRQRNYRRNV